MNLDYFCAALDFESEFKYGFHVRCWDFFFGKLDDCANDAFEVLRFVM